MIKIRLSRYGRSHLPFYRIVAIDSRVKRDGGYVELLGTYDPLKKRVDIKTDSVKKWLNYGAQPSQTVKAIFKKEKIWSEFVNNKSSKQTSKQVSTAK